MVCKPRPWFPPVFFFLVSSRASITESIRIKMGISIIYLFLQKTAHEEKRSMLATYPGSPNGVSVADHGVGAVENVALSGN